jgi:sugar phosphate permease
MRARWLILWLIWLTLFVAYLDRVNISIAAPAMMSELRMSPAVFGGVLSAFSLGYALMQIPGGYLADRFGARALLALALLVWSLFTGLTGLAASVSGLIVVRVLFGVGEGLENGAQLKLIGDNFSSRERSSASALFLTAIALGPAVVAPLTAWLLGHAGWRGVFLWFTIPGLIVAVLVYALIPAQGRTAPVPAQADAFAVKEQTRAMMRRSTSWLVFAAYVCFNVAFWGFIGWMPSYLKLTRHISLSALGLYGSLPYLCGFAGLLLIGWLGHKPLYRQRALLVGASYLLAGASLYLAFSAGTVERSVIGLSFAGLFLYGGFGPFWAIALDLTPAALRGTFTGFINFGGQIGGFSAPLAVGAIVSATGSFNGGFLFMIASLILAALSLFWLHLRVPSPAARPS